MAVKRVSDYELLSMIDDFRSEYGYAPSYRELAERCEMGISAIGYRIKQLRKEGLLENAEALSARTLVLAPAGIQYIQHQQRAADRMVQA